MGSTSISVGIQWTPPGSAANSGNSTLTSVGTENSQSVGKIDIPAATVAPATYVVPFGSVSAAKTVIIQNLMSTEIGVRLNGAVADNFTLGAGQTFIISGPVAGTTVPITAASVLTTDAPTEVEYVNFWIFGD